jgi:hypothetical protein
MGAILDRTRVSPKNAYAICDASMPARANTFQFRDALPRSTSRNAVQADFAGGSWCRTALR